MTVEEVLASEPVVFDDVEAGDWVTPVWPDGPKWPPARVISVDESSGARVLVCQSVYATVIGSRLVTQLYVVDRTAWEKQGASRFQWLRLTGLRRMVEAVGRVG